MTDTVVQENEKIRKEDAKRKRQLLSIAPFILLCVAVLAAGWMGLGNFFDEDRGVWFAKSGACVTALSIVISQRIQILEGMIFPRSSFVPAHVAQLWQRWAPRLKMLQRINLCLGISSALIWGYGDTLFKAVSTNMA